MTHLMERPDPGVALRFLRNILGMKPWERQEDVVRAVFGPKRTTAVKSCHASGKTHVAAGITLAWLITRPQRVVITTAPTHRQVRELLWKEIRKLHAGALEPLGGVLPPSDPSLRIEEGWLALGFSSDNPTNVQGHHAPGGVLVVMDEAAGVNPEIWDSLQGVMTGANDRFLCIGNPTARSGPFFGAFADPDVEKITISAFDTPNVRAGREVIPGLITTQFVEHARRKWGEGSALWRSRVLGEFPATTDEGLVPLEWVEAAERRWEKLNQANGHGWRGPFMLGVDVARYGPDFTVAARACAQGVQALTRMPKMDTQATSGWVVRHVEDGGADVGAARVDADGVGAGVFDSVRETLGSSRVVEMRGGMSALEHKKYTNRRAEWFWQLRERLDPARADALALPPNEELRTQLTTMRWKVSAKGQIQIESKEDMRARGMDSPDEADAVAYATAILDPLAISVSLDPDLGRGINPWSF